MRFQSSDDERPEVAVEDVKSRHPLHVRAGLAMRRLSVQVLQRLGPGLVATSASTAADSSTTYRCVIRACAEKPTASALDQVHRAGTARPASRFRTPGKRSRLIPFAAAASRDACGRYMPGAPMRRWSGGIYADPMARTRREESPRPFSGSAVLNFAENRLRSARRAPRAAAGQHRHGAGAARRQTYDWRPASVRRTNDQRRRA